MGAKSVEITKIDESKESNTTELKGGYNKFTASVGASVISELQQLNKLIVKFEGRSSDISSDILKNSVWFQNDSQMNAILEGRLQKSKLTEYDITARIEQTFKFDFSAAANVLDMKVASLKKEYEKASKQTRKFHVIFGE